MEQIAAIAGVTWLLVEIVHNLGPLKGVDNRIIALVIGLGIGVAGYLTSYLSGQPVDVLIKVIVAVLGAQVGHDLLAKPLTGDRV